MSLPNCFNSDGKYVAQDNCVTTCAQLMSVEGKGLRTCSSQNGGWKPDMSHAQCQDTGIGRYTSENCLQTCCIKPNV